MGACTAFAATGLLSYPQWFSMVEQDAYVKAFGPMDGTGALRFYSAEETLDGDGPYPPQDNGSSGLTAAKVARGAGLIPGWTQTFTLEDALTFGQKQPFIAGTDWFNSMFQADAEGIVKVDPNSGLAGGHEYVVSSFDSARGLVGFDNSWSTDWGKAGRFFIEVESWGQLLARQGDTTFFTPVSQPAPTPTPVPPATALEALGQAVRHNGWYQHHHVGDNAHVAHAAAAAIAAGEI